MFKFFDDIVPPDTANDIERYCLEDMLWWYNKNISGVSKVVELPSPFTPAAVENGFASKIYERGDDSWDGAVMNMLMPMIKNIMEMIPFETTLTRVRGGMFLPTVSGGVHTPHIDYYYPHYTLLYYVNNSDGDTILWNQRASEEDPERYPDRFTTLATVSPRKGSAVLFNGMNYHSSSLPQKSSERIAININFLTNTF